MAYQITEFDGVLLPVYNPRQDHSGTTIESSLRNSVGGVYDYYGANKRKGKRQAPTITGVYIGEKYYLTDESGVYLTDETGALLTGEDGASNLASQVDALRAKIGVQGSLVRVRMGDDMRQYITATLLGVPHAQVVEDQEFKVELTCNFESAMGAWHREDTSSVSKTLVAGEEALLVENLGSVAVDDAIISVNATGTITSLRIVCLDTGVDLSWTGSIAPGYTLVIDNGEMTIRNQGVNAFSGLTRNAGHTAKGWLPLDVGPNLWIVTSNAAGNIAARWHDQWQ